MHIEQRHLTIIKDILVKYPYTFYIFGSRARGKPKKLSDLDLCFFEDIPWNERAHIDEDFEESDLPFEVDVVDWNMCDDAFRKLIQQDMMCIQVGVKLKEAEKSFFEYFCYLSKELNFNVKEDSKGKRVNCGLRSSMFNIVCDINVKDDEARSYIESLTKEFDSQPLACWLGPSVSPKNFREFLLEAGFKSETTEYAMICDLARTSTATPSLIGFSVKVVDTHKTLQNFISVLETVDESGKYFFEKLKYPNQYERQKLFVGYENDIPVTIAMLYINGEMGSIFTLITREDKRGRGYGTALTEHLMKYAKERGALYASLLASSNSGVSIYTKLEFKSLGLFECYEYIE